MTFEQFLLILRARIWIILFTVGVALAGATAVSLYMPKEFTASADLIIDAKGADPVAGTSISPQLMPAYVATQVDVIRSKRVARNVVELLKLDSNPVEIARFNEAGGGGDIKDWLASQLVKNIVVTPSRESNIISIAFTGYDPRFAASAANFFSEAYIRANIEIAVDPAKQVLTWYGDQIRQLRTALEAAQIKLSKFERENGIVASQDRFDVEAARLQELYRQLVVAETERSQQQSRWRPTETGEAPEDLPEVQNNALIQRLKIDVVALESKLTDLSTKVGQNHPQYQRAADELANLRERLNAERADVTKSLRTAATAAKRQEASLRNATNEQRARIMSLTRQHDEAAVLMREVDNAQRAYDFAMQRASQSSLQSQVSQTNISILNQASPPITPSRPRVLLNIASAVFLGTLLGVAIAFFVEIRNRLVRSAQDLNLDNPLPVFGSLPKSRHGTFSAMSRPDFLEKRVK